MLRVTSFEAHSWWIEVAIEFDHARYPSPVIVVHTPSEIRVGWLHRLDDGDSINTSSVIYRSIVTSHQPDGLPTYLLVDGDGKVELVRFDL